jgi:hypothetical protein
MLSTWPIGAMLGTGVAQTSKFLFFKKQKQGEKVIRGEHFMNRERLAQLIFWMRSFTEDELIQTFGRLWNGKTEIGPLRSLHDYLENLKESGVLGFEGGRYTLLNPAKGRRTVVA